MPWAAMTAKCTTTAGFASDVVREEQERNEKNKKDAEEAARQKEARYCCARFCPAPAPNLSSLQQEQLVHEDAQLVCSGRQVGGHRESGRC